MFKLCPYIRSETILLMFLVLNIFIVIHMCTHMVCVLLVCVQWKWMANSNGWRAHLFPRFCVCGAARVPGPGAGAAPPGAGGGIAVELVAGLLHRHRLAYVLQYHPHYGHYVLPLQQR